AGNQRGSYGRVHVGDRGDSGGAKDGFVFQRRQACGRESGGRDERAGGGTAAADLDVRRAVAERAETAAGTGVSDGPLPGSRQTEFCRGGRPLPRRVPLCAGDSGRGLRQRRGGAGAGDEGGREASVSSGAKRTADGGRGAAG